MKKLLSCLGVVFSCFMLLFFSACTADPYKDYAASGIDATAISVKSEEDFDLWAGFSSEKAKIFTDYTTFAKYNFPLDYTKEFFENNDLLIFMTSACSSDNMEFSEILINGAKLYPTFLRNKIDENGGVTTDIIFIPYYAELSKSDNYKLGEVIYKYR